MIVVDTNIIAYLLIPNDHFTELAINVLEKDKNWLAPALWRYELLSVLTSYHRKELINSEALKSIYNKACEIVETREVLNIDLLLNCINNSKLSAYDCQYVAVARDNNLPLVTQDKKILREFPEVGISPDTFCSQF